MFSSEQHEAFQRDGYLIVERDFISPEQVDVLRERFDAIFRQEYETGIRPDEVNWVAGRDPENRTRQICNGWKADTTLARQVLSERTGAACAELMGYDGVRILQDNCIWKPPGTLSLGMHQDGAFLDYLHPGEMITCWIALEPTSAEAGTMTFVTGSHKWPRSAKNRSEFHAPPDWLEPARRANPAGEDAELDLQPVVVEAGGASFHHHLTFHGSGPNTNTTAHRRALISHLLPAASTFDREHTDLVYSRYRRRDTDAMDESFFPVVWSADGNRSAWLAELDRA